MLREEPDDDRVVLHRAHHAAALDREVDHLGEDDLACPGAVGLGIGRVHRRLQLRELDLDRGDDDLVLGLVLVVDRGLRDADVVGDHLERRAVHPVLGEEAERRVDDPGLRGTPGHGAESA